MLIFSPLAHAQSGDAAELDRQADNAYCSRGLLLL
jgi:hypothetical protein